MNNSKKDAARRTQHNGLLLPGRRNVTVFPSDERHLEPLNRMLLHRQESRRSAQLAAAISAALGSSNALFHEPRDN